MTKTFKVLGIGVLATVLLTVGGIVVNDQMQESDLRDAQARSEIAESQQRMQGRLKDAQLDLVGTTYGYDSVRYLEYKICLEAGYPNNQGTYNGLSQRQAAGCAATDAAISKQERANDAEKAKLDAAYDKQHSGKR